MNVNRGNRNEGSKIIKITCINTNPYGLKIWTNKCFYNYNKLVAGVFVGIGNL